MCIHSCFHTSSGILFKCIRRHCNDRNIFCILPVHRANPFRCSDSIHVWHHDIHQDRIKSSRFTSDKCIDRLLSILEKTGGGLFLLGSKPGVAELAAQKMTEKHPKLYICGMNDGYFKDEAPVIEKINAAKPDVLFVCLGAPKQELFMAKYGEATGCHLLMGLGGSMDIFAGVAQRAPEFYCKHNLEWFYRLIKNPPRFGRMMKLPLFLVHVSGEKRK